MKQQQSKLAVKFPYLVMWCRMMGAYEYYIDSQLAKADRLNAPQDTVYFDDDMPRRFEDVKGASVIEYFRQRGLQKGVTTLQKLANATKTFYECIGHHKSERNEQLMYQYIDELEAMGVPIPSEEERLKIGEFNGAGSY